MKSRVLRLFDYKTIDIKPLLKPFVPDEEALEKELQRLANRHIRWEEGTTLSAGDQAVCRLESECPRFRKEKVRFVAGSGMFHRELEALAVGMSVGESKTLELPEGKVCLILTAVMNRNVPPVSDGMVEELGLEDIRTVEAYRAYLLAQQKEAAFQDALPEPQRKLMREVCGRSEFILYKEDWSAVVAQELERCRVLSRQEGLTLEEMTPEQFVGRIPVKSYHELVAMLEDEGWDRLCEHLLGCLYAEGDGFQPKEADYEAFIADYVKTWHTTEEKAREANTLDYYLFHQYIGHAHKIHTQCIREQYGDD